MHEYYEWRCNCGTENHPVAVVCFACAKRRWAHLGLSYWAMLELLGRILPNHLIERIVKVEG
jgi:hypothetical protein